MQKETISFIILAAGRGSRMNSSTPKVLHKVASLPIIFHILNTVLSLRNKIAIGKIIVVISPKSELLKKKISCFYPNVEFCVQKNQYGTADAVLSTKNILKISSKKIMILSGDTPLITKKLLINLNKVSKINDVSVSVFKSIYPFGYGRIILDKLNKISMIVEEKDANKEQKKIDICNTGIYIANAKILFKLLSKVKFSKNRKEKYLTDMISIAKKENNSIGMAYSKEIESMGINDRLGLSLAEKEIQNILRNKAMKKGVTLVAPETVYFSADTKVSKDVYIGPNVVFGPGVKIEEGVKIEAFCHIEGVVIKKNSIIGPFARLRPGTIIEESVKIGNFVEVKKSNIKKGSKVNHLSYIGDSDIGENVNIGAGVITCNYDGVNKNKTKISNNSFIGSNVSLVAPVKVGSNSIVGAGSVITKNIPENTLAVERNKQNNIKKKIKNSK